MRYVYAILLMSMCQLSCQKDLFHVATVKDYGSPALDGCGWVIEIDEIAYQPVSIDSIYLSDNLTIRIRYELTGDKGSCGLMPNALDRICILDIQ